jgi:hypothetical protein
VFSCLKSYLNGDLQMMLQKEPDKKCVVVNEVDEPCMQLGVDIGEKVGDVIKQGDDF